MILIRAKARAKMTYLLHLFMTFIILFNSSFSFALAYSSETDTSTLNIVFLENQPLVKPIEKSTPLQTLQLDNSEKKDPIYPSFISPPKALGIYSPSALLQIRRQSGTVNVSAPLADQWELFGEANKKMQHNKSSFRVIGGVQLNW